MAVGYFKAPRVEKLSVTVIQELLLLARAVSGLKPWVKWKRGDVMTEECFMFFTVKVIASQVKIVWI